MRNYFSENRLIWAASPEQPEPPRIESTEPAAPSVPETTPELEEFNKQYTEITTWIGEAEAKDLSLKPLLENFRKDLDDAKADPEVAGQGEDANLKERFEQNKIAVRSREVGLKAFADLKQKFAGEEPSEALTSAQEYIAEQEKEYSTSSLEDFDTGNDADPWGNIETAFGQLDEYKKETGRDLGKVKLEAQDPKKVIEFREEMEATIASTRDLFELEKQTSPENMEKIEEYLAVLEDDALDYQELDDSGIESGLSTEGGDSDPSHNLAEIDGLYDQYLIAVGRKEKPESKKIDLPPVQEITIKGDPKWKN